MSYVLASWHLYLLQALPTDPAQEPLWRLILRDFPRDAGAITLYVLLAASIALVWWAHRNSGRAGESSHVGDDLGEAPDTASEDVVRTRPARGAGRAAASDHRTLTDRRPAAEGPTVTDRPPATPRRPRRAA